MISILQHPVSDTSKLEAAIKAAEALNKEDYTEASWSNLEAELAEAKRRSGNCSDRKNQSGEY